MGRVLTPNHIRSGRTNATRAAIPLLMLASSVLACAQHGAGRRASAGRATAGAQVGTASTITFTNRRPEPVTVYLATQSGVERLLGRVDALKTASLSLPRATAREATLARIVVVPIGSWHVYMPQKALIPDAILSEPEPIEELLLKRWDLAGRQLAGFIMPPGTR
jgi:hypothetical protein